MPRRKKRVEWSSQARLDLLAVVDYLRAERPAAARRFLEQLERRLDQVARFPESGRPISEQLELGAEEEPGQREVIVMRWRVAYHIADRITVLYVIHGARRFPPAR